MSAAALQVSLLVGLLLSGLGLTGILVRRNGLSIVLGIQLMGIGAVLAMTAFAHHHADSAGRAAALIALAAVVAQAAVILSLVCLNRRRAAAAEAGAQQPELEE